jgi:hypothetical protein
MGIFSFSHSSTLSILLAPVHALVAWFMPTQNASGRFAPPAGAQCSSGQLVLPFGSRPLSVHPQRHASGAAAAAHQSPASTAAGAITSKSSKPSLKSPAPSRLRVVREFDSNVGPACAGRMVISGRMADVCAELERMAQREAA